MINNMTLQGRLCDDPVLRYTQSGTPVCSFRVAWSEKYKETETKLFLSCTAWRGTGEFVSQWFSKGDMIAVEGRLVTRNWTDRDGANRQSIELTVSKAHFCGSKSMQAAEGCNASDQGYNSGYSALPAQGFQELADDEMDGELPF